jgi:hypothetical protein
MMLAGLLILTGILVAASERIINESTWLRCLWAGVITIAVVWAVGYVIVRFAAPLF